MSDSGTLLRRDVDERAIRPASPSPGEPEGDAWRLRESAQTQDDPLLRALETLTQLHGRPTSAQALAAGLPLPEGRMIPPLAPRALERAGLSARLVRRPIVLIDDLSLPCILFLKDRQCVVLTGRDGDRLQIVMPETGRGTGTVDRASIESRYDGHALFARPEIGYEQRDRPIALERKGHWFWATLLRQWPTYAEVMVAAVLINVFALASPLFVMNVYDRVVPNNAIHTLWVLAIGALTVFAFDFILKTLRGYFIDTAGRIADIRLASRIFEHVLGIKMAARPASAGAFANHLREFESLRDFFTSATVTTLVDLPFVFFFIGIVWLLGGPVALVPLAALPIVIGIGLLMQIPLNRIVRRTFKEAAAKHGVLVEAINGLETIKTSAARASSRPVGSAMWVPRRERQPLALPLGHHRQRRGAGDPARHRGRGHRRRLPDRRRADDRGCARRLHHHRRPRHGALGPGGGLLTRYHQAKMAYDTLNRVMAMPLERSAEVRFLSRPRAEGGIELKNVTLTYPGQKLPALTDVSFRIQPASGWG